jgi:hypothetical protein
MSSIKIKKIAFFIAPEMIPFLFNNLMADMHLKIFSFFFTFLFAFYTKYHYIK